MAVQAQTTTVFTGDDTNKIPYRIPAIVQTSNEDILVFADKRYNGGDVGQNGSDASRIDVVYKRRNSQGEWDTNETVVKNGTSSFGYGDVAVVADRENPAEIVFFTAAGNVFFTSSTQSSPLRCYRFHSNDGGATWDNDETTGEKGTEVTSQIYGLASDYRGAFFSSGRICQSSKIKVGSHYRLYAALCVYKKGGLFNASNKTYSLVIYSDDFGDTWNLLGTQPVIGEGGDEAKCVELPNGNVLVSSKGKSTRYFNVFKYTNNVLPTTENTADGSWTGQVEGCTSSDAAGTNGELLLVQASKDGKNCYLVMQTIPASSTKASTRKNVTLYWKELDTSDLNDASQFSGAWSNTYRLAETEETTSSYSTMIQLADGSIAFAYEENYESYSSSSSIVYDSYDIQFRNQSISDIASGYTLPVLDAPVINPEGGEIEAGATATVTINAANKDATIYYTTDGSTPTTSSNVYSGAITVNSAMIIKAIAVKKAWTNSSVASATFTIKEDSATPVDPTISLSAAATTLTVGETTALTLTTNSDGAVSYTSSNTAVATVSASGVVTAVAAGEVTITANVAATEQYNAASATVTITVEAKAEEVTTYEVTAVGGEIGTTSYYIATFSAPVATIVPSGVKAYYVKVGGSDVVTLTRISSGKVIPAGQGVILISSTQTFTMTSTTDESNVADLTGNLLVASLDGFIPAGNYVLAVKGSGTLEGQFAFCLTSSDLDNLSGNRAYLQLSGNNAPQMRMRIEEESTDIEASEPTSDEAPVIYDLTGRRVTEMLPGRIYIVNGKKIVR